MTHDQVLYVLSPHIAEIDEITRAFSEQGFRASGAPTMSGLVSLISLRRPNAVVLDYQLGFVENDAIGIVNSMAFGVCFFTLCDLQFDARDAVRVVRSGALSLFNRPFAYTAMTGEVIEELRANILHSGSAHSATPSSLTTLTEREFEVLHQIVEGRSNKQAALALGISPRTVETHRASLIQKIGARNTAEMIRIVLRH